MVAVSADQFVEKYIALPGAGDQDLDRVVTAPSGLDAVGMLEALAHPSFTEPGRQAIALQMMSDFMAPTGSIYYDAIYGAFDGQVAVRNWLIPTMATIDFIEFVPTAPPALIDDGLGGTSVDEWQMFAVIGDERMPLPKGVSVRRYRDGWITWACDVYDTAAFRHPPPPARIGRAGRGAVPARIRRRDVPRYGQPGSRTCPPQSPVTSGSWTWAWRQNRRPRPDGFG